MEKQPRWKSWVMWTAVVSQITALLLLFGVIDIGMSQKIETATVIVLNLFSAMGIVNNPTDKINW